MTPIKRNLNYQFRGTLLRLRLRWNSGKVLQLATGYHVDREKWNGTRCNRNTFHGDAKVPAATINAALDRLEEKIDKAYLFFELRDAMPSADELGALIRDRAGSLSRTDFFTLFDRFLSDGHRTKQWTDSTFRRIKALKPLLLQFDSNVTHPGHFEAEGISEHKPSLIPSFLYKPSIYSDLQIK